MMEENTELKALDVVLRNVYNSDDIDVEAALKAVRHKAFISSVADRGRRLWPFAVAAAIICGVLLFAPALNPGKSAEKVIRLANTESSPMHINLPDGSEVWLHSGSELEYGKDFSTGGRSVRFSGEAYFNVASNPEMPFYVVTPSMRVKVTGTIFNIKDRPSSISEVVLAKGSVMIQNAEGNDILRLKPGQKASWIAEEGVLDIAEVPVGDLLLVNYGVISLENVTADQIASVIESTFGVHLVSEGGSSDAVYEFNFQKDSSPESVVELLNFICKDQKFTIER